MAKTIIKIQSGEIFEGFIPFIDKLKWFFRFKKIPKEKVLWKNIDNGKVYYFDRNKSALILKVKDKQQRSVEDKMEDNDDRCPRCKRVVWFWQNKFLGLDDRVWHKICWEDKKGRFTK